MNAVSNWNWGACCNVHNLLFSWISIRWKIFIINFFFKILLVLNVDNYLCSKIQVRLGENFIFLLFSYMCFWQLSASGHYPARPLDLIWWLTFQVSDWWNSIDLADFSSNRPMKFHKSDWFFKYRTDGIPSIWSWKYQNSLHSFTLSTNWVELYFWPLGHLSNGFHGGKLKK